MTASDKFNSCSKVAMLLNAVGLVELKRCGHDVASLHLESMLQAVARFLLEEGEGKGSVVSWWEKCATVLFVRQGRER